MTSVNLFHFSTLDKIFGQNIFLFLDFVSNTSLEKLVVSFWAKAVFIKGIADNKGGIQLAEIKRAA